MSYSRARFLDRSTPPHIFTLVLLAGVSALNMSIFLSSLPIMTEELETEYAVMQLSISMYLGFTAGLQVIIGPISDRYGRRPVVLFALGLFVFASVACYFSGSIQAFLIWRMVSASVAVGMVTSRAIVRDEVEVNEAASTIGYVTMGMSLVPMFAPTIGGFVDQLFGWRAVFLFSASFGAALLLLCYFDQGETNKKKSASFKAQFLDYPELFMSPRFWGYALSAAFASGAFFAFLGGAPYVAATVFGLPPETTKWLFGIPAIGYFVGNLMSGKLSERFGVNNMVLAGCIILVFGMACSLLVTVAGYGSAFSFFGFCIFVGLGNGLVLPNSTAGLLSVRPHLAGSASGVGGGLMIGGGAILAALAGVLLEQGEGSLPLQWVMLLSNIAGLVSILLVMKRERRLAASLCKD